jgi:peptidylprolyl isomerase
MVEFKTKKNKNFVTNFFSALVGLLVGVFGSLIFQDYKNRKDLSAKIQKLSTKDLKAGTGREVKQGDYLLAHYVGYLADGIKFDDTYEKDQPLVAQIGVGQLILGLEKGILGMREGGTRKIIIPAELAYGKQTMPSIPIDSALIFEVEVLEVLDLSG